MSDTCRILSASVECWTDAIVWDAISVGDEAIELQHVEHFIFCEGPSYFDAIPMLRKGIATPSVPSTVEGGDVERVVHVE